MSKQGVIAMRLADKPFELIKSGVKTVEVRLYDEKRRALKVGDNIIFLRSADPNDKIRATVKALYKFDTFSDLYSSELFEKCGCGGMTAEQAVEYIYGYYTKENERRYGVLGIEIEAVNG